uniref:Uncharacterized protein n=1 Tax=Arundo donax TaxID=35708 RepID=A0A0A8YQA1_ARUDO
MYLHFICFNARITTNSIIQLGYVLR